MARLMAGPPVVGKSPFQGEVGSYRGKRLLSNGGITATVWEHDKSLSLLFSADFEEAKGVFLGNLAVRGEGPCMEAQLRGLMSILNILLEENHG